jgi:hypothetical protein
VCGNVGRNDVEYDFVFYFPAGASVAVEVYILQSCRPVVGAGWVFHAANGTVAGVFALSGAAADSLRSYVNGPEG